MNNKLRITSTKMKRIVSSLLVFSIGLTNPAFAIAQAPVASNSAQVSNIAQVTQHEENEFDDLKNSLLLDSSLKSLTDNQNAPTIARGQVRSKIKALTKKTFKATERIPVVVEDEDPSRVIIEVFNSDGEKVNATIEDDSISTTAILRVSPPSHFKPGRYHMKITDSQGTVSTQDFTWGVLAINTNKSIYLPNETAKIYMAVLDETGNMVCDAKVTLDIKDPQGKTLSHSTEDSSIKVNPQCQLKVFSLEQDFEARYTTGGVGTYDMTLTSVTKNGTYTITDKFEVAESIPFDVERTSATRIFPPLQYPVLFTIKANQDFEGDIKEVVPENFIVENIDGLPAFEAIATNSAIQSGDNNKTVSISRPFAGQFAQTQGFGVDETDLNMAAKYQKYGLLGHDGLDFALPTGTPVLSVDDGVIVRAAANGDYGTTVIVQHSWGRSYYGHLSKIETELGTTVSRGEKIGLSGNTGLLTTGPHLHFGIKFDENNPANGYYGKVNPLPYLNNSLSVSGGTATPAASLVNEDSTGVQILTWKLKIAKGDTINLGYKYLAPKKSPQFYTVGPLSFNLSGEDGFPEFIENRKWQIAVDADGSGTMTVSPTTSSTSGTSKTYTFTYTASEDVSSGGLTIQEPTADDWTVPQGTAGVAGYTTVTTDGLAVVGDVLTNADTEDPTSPAGVWQEVDADMCGSTTLNAAADIVVDTTNKIEGTGSIQCADTNGQPDNNDDWGFIYDANQNWNTFCGGAKCTTISWWQRASNVATENFEFDVSDTTDLSTNVAACAGSVTAANTWEYRTCDISAATLTTVKGFGFSCTNNNCLPFETDNFNVDEFLIGPGSPTFSGTSPWTITVRFLDILSTETVTVTYGSGGGTSGVTNSATDGIHTFNTASKTLVSGTYTALSSSPTVTLSSGPTNDQIMRSGKWFQNGVEQPFTF